MILSTAIPNADPLRAAIRAAYLADEAACIERLLPLARFDAPARARIEARARALVEAVRRRRRAFGGVDAFLQEYNLNTQEGIVLLCLAEALLRIPDRATADRLIRDKFELADFERHLGHSASWLVNASTWGLMLTGRLVGVGDGGAPDAASALRRLVARTGEEAARLALTQAMAILARQFVMGRHIEEALARSRTDEQRRYRHSYDMLGEAALTAVDAERYEATYRHAITAVGATAHVAADVFGAPSVSVKLSALHPRFEFAQAQRLRRELVPRVQRLVAAAQAAGIGVTLDTEEAARLEPTLDVFAAVHATLGGYQGFGLAVQAYQKRALPVVDWLVHLASGTQRRIPVRLVKGAYWDSEIKRAQEDGLRDYPVFTRKSATDVSYLACARQLLAARDRLYPQFATHNAHTIAAILEMAGATGEFELQRLHGMGEALYAEIVGAERFNVPCRVYAPVGSHADLLPYLVRRLLENGANTSFVYHVLNEQTPIEMLVADPAERLARSPLAARILPPPELFGAARRNSLGLNLNDSGELAPLAGAMHAALQQPWTAAPLVSGRTRGGSPRPLPDPSDRRRTVGSVIDADATAVAAAFAAAAAAQPDWDRAPAETRAACLERAAELIEDRRAAFVALLVREGGKCLPDALAEVREAADYCRYYAQRVRAEFAAPQLLNGPTGERNELQWHGRGVFLCLSPWNFPLAIFVGQVAAALAAGNSVVAKPASQTPLVAHLAVRELHAAGIPAAALHYLPGASARIGAALLADPRLAGVAFTGSTDTAQALQRALAARPGPIVPLVAETGGINAMIVDSSALPEQVVTDVLRSAFNSAGQRCSALRVLFVQEEIAPRVLRLLAGALAELAIGDPALLATDVGPVIDASAQARLERHVQRLEREARRVAGVSLPPDTRHGSFFAPCVFEIENLAQLEAEVFGPVLHVIRFAGDRLDAVVEAINDSGYGLTLGIQSRIEGVARAIQARARVGNTYVNRNMIGAVVGVQPFGGEGLSGTGPKAGGPHYLHRFATERTLTVNTAALGGNAALLSLDDDLAPRPDS
jgi:RHH-type proline utilization regulon transcriptional repressor/proline dehydrogenase/delta 1-pyrroline-5-carboxylate dehydrogenase